MSGDLQFAGAVEARGLEVVLGDGGDAGHEEDEMEADVLPADGDEDGGQGG